MLRPIPLGQVPFLAQLPSDWQDPLEAYLATTLLKQVEVLPKERKWILHLTSTQNLDSALLRPLGNLLIEHVGEINNVDWQIDCQSALSANEVFEVHWQEIIKDLSNILPGMRGWLGEETRYQVAGRELIIYVPNALGAEYIQAKHHIVENYLQVRFGIKVAVCCELDSDQTAAEYLDQTENLEQECLQELFASNSNSGDEKPDKIRDNCLLGREFKVEAVSLRQVRDEERQIIVTGQVFNLDYRQLKTGRKLLTFDLTDKTDSISAKVFLKEEQASLDLANGDWISARGPVKYDRFSSILTLMPKDIILPSRLFVKIMRSKTSGITYTRVMSTMDAVASAEDLVKRAKFWGHKAVAITDHGVVQAFPEAVDAGKKYGVKIILGVEGYLFDDSSGPGALNQRKTQHIILLVRNSIGLKNLYHLITYSHLDYFYRRPRMPKSKVNALREGILLGSACEAGELIQAILRKESWEKLLDIAAFYDYLEIQPLGNNSFLLRNGQVSSIEELQEINKTIIRLGKELQKPVVATGDVHFMDPEE